MPVRVISWNIKNFARNHLATNQAIIMRRLYDQGERLCDMFVIIEPLIKNAKPPVGSVITSGAGCEGLMDLFYLLRAKDPLWKVVPPRASCCGKKSDFVGMLYHSGVVELTGPETMNPVPAAVAGVVGGIQAWVTVGAAPVPQVRFLNLGKEIQFHGRRPAMATFNGAKYVETRQYTITIHAVAPAVVAALVPLGIKTASLPVGAPNEAYDFTLQAEGAAGITAWTISAGGPLPGGLNLDAATGRLHGTTAFAGTQNVTFQLDDTPGFGPKPPAVTKALTLDFNAELRLRSGPALPDGVQTVPYDVQLDACGGALPRTFVLALRAGEGLPPGLTMNGTGRIQGTPAAAGNFTFTVDTSDNPSNAFNLMGLHAPPDGGKNYPKNANSSAIANVAKIAEIKGVTASAVCGDFNCCPLVCCNAGLANKQLTALNTLGAQLTHRNFNERTSLKQPGSATYNDYRSEYFDHIFTRNFASVPAFGLLNLITSDPNWAVAQANAILGNTNDFDVLFARYSWPGGASDHLPTHFTLGF